MSISYLRAGFVCDRCGNVSSVIGDRMTTLRTKLRKLGWHISTGKDYCPNCHPKPAVKL